MTTAITDSSCWYLTGPTASGKTAVGVELALLLNAEIISMDSMAIFRGMDIGTAKPTPAERARVPHHLIDIVDPSEDFSLAAYLDAAQAAVREITSRGRVPLFVGGTPLYLKALLRGIFSGPAADWELRKRLQARAESEGVESLHRALAQVDPRTAERLHPQDMRRVIRALEVWERSGRSISDQQQEFEEERTADECRVFVLHWPRAELVHRIDQRVDQMFAKGLVEEVVSLATGPRQLSRTAQQALGYREVLAALPDNPNYLVVKELVKTRTRQFAKRQMTWFRSLSECRPVEMRAGMTSIEVAKQLHQLGQ